ncbi:hypothetical protein ABPG72_018253 [Tetrahymena utriculariae]
MLVLYTYQIILLFALLQIATSKTDDKHFLLQQNKINRGNDFLIGSQTNIANLQQNFPLYSQIPLSQFQLDDLCPSNQIALINNIIQLQNVESKNLIVIGIANCGLALINTQNLTNFQPIWFYSYKQQVTSLCLTQNESLLWVGLDNSTVVIFDFKDKYHIQFKISIVTTQFVYKFLFSSNEQILFVAGFYQLQVYDVSNVLQPNLLQSLPQQIGNQQAFFSLQLAINETYLFAANDEKGVSIFKINQNISQSDGKNYPTLQYLCSTQFSWSSTYDIIIYQDKYMYVLQELSGLFQVDLSQFWLTQDCSQLKIINEIDFAAKTTSMLINSSSFSIPYLFLGVRSTGLLIISLSDPYNFVVFQQISINGLALKIELSQDSKYVYYSNGLSLLAFNKQEPNFNLQKPNILNDHQAFFYPNTLFNIADNWSWRCAFSNNTLFQARNREGNLAVQVSGNGFGLQKLSIIFQNQQSKQTGVNGLKVLKDQRHLIIGVSNQGVAVVDYLDLNNPQIIFNSTFGLNDNDSDSIYLNKNETILVVASGRRGVLIINSTNLSNLTLISNFVLQDYQIIGTCEDALITQNSQYIFATVRSYGLILIDVTNIQAPQIKNQFITLGAESIIFTQNETFLILSNGFQGIKTFDISDINKIQILGEVQIDGQCLHIRSLFNDNFILVTLQEKGQLALVDITQIGQPLLIQKYQYHSEDIAYDVCLNDDQSIAYLMGRSGNIIIPLKSEIILHTEIFQTKVGSNGKIYVQSLRKNDILLVGMSVLFQIAPLFSSHKLFIKSCYYYEYYNKDNLPSWIQFKQAAQELQLTITKESLNTNINGIMGRTNHQIILLVYQEIQDLDFISQENQINPLLSSQIKKLCQSQGIIDNVGFITEYFNPYTQFSLQGFNGTDSQLLYINQILKMKVINYPIYFTTDSSLVLNLTDSINVISSQSSSLQMYISVDPNFARFVDIKYKGALISLSQDSSTIMLQGETCQVNQLVAQGFYIQNFLNTQDINVTISAYDQMNYQFEKSYTFSEVSFMKILENIQVSKTCNLQCEFNQYYSDGAIPINEQFKFQISDSIFINQSQQKTQYKVNLLIDDQLLQTSKKYWLIFDQATNTLSGQPGFEQVGQVITVQVNATDSYSSVVDSFSFTVKKDNTSLFLKIFLAILLPLVILLILLQFKSSFYNLFFTQNFVYSTETTEIGKEYTKQIILRDEVFRVAKIIWEQYKKKIEIEIVMQEIQKLKNKKDESNESNSMSTNKIQQNNQVENINSENFFKRKNFDQNVLQPIQENLVATEDPALKESQFERKNEKQNKLDKELNFRYFLENGEINFNLILKQMSIFFDQINNNQPDISLGQRVNSEDIINTSTKISKILQGFFVKYCISLDQDLQLIFEKIKSLALNNFNNLDWYKAYVNIVSDLDDVSECSIPVITVNEFIFSKTIQIIYHICPFKMQNLLFIIKESVISTAYGFEEIKNRRWKQRTFGETIYKENTKIQSIQILQKVRNRSFQQKWGSYRFFRDLGFKQCPQTQNYGLPQWMNTLEIINGSIIIGGQPMASDVGQYLIRIFDNNSYIIREFKIFVIKKQIFTQYDHVNNASSSKSNFFKQLHQNVPQLSIKFNSRLPISSNIFLNPSISSAHGNLIVRDNQEEQIEQMNE